MKVAQKIGPDLQQEWHKRDIRNINNTAINETYTIATATFVASIPHKFKNPFCCFISYMLPYDTQVQTLEFIMVKLHNKRNVGIHPLLIRFLRPTTALSADEQSDTHVTYCWCTRKVCVEGLVSPHAHNGIHVFSIPVTSTLHCLWHSSECGNFRKPIDKASCDTFPLCSAPPFQLRTSPCAS